MNKKERELLLTFLAYQEWQQGGSTGETVGRMTVVEEIAKLFKFTPEERLFDRVWEMCKNTCEQVGVPFEPIPDDDDAAEEIPSFVDKVYDYACDHGYQETVDLLEGESWEAFYYRFMPKE